MAIILKTKDNEDGFYQKIILENCYININGLYVETIVFKNKEERNKDKNRQKDIDNFIYNYNSKLEEIENIQDETLKSQQREIFEKVQIFSHNFIGKMYIGLQDENKERPALDEEALAEAEKYGFKKEWYENPIVIVRHDKIRVEGYKKQDFSLDAFYASLKNNIYTDKDGNLLVEDDL
jgi:hypothetical protein